MRRLFENLDGLNENHIFPLFWQHGEDEGTLREFMGKIQESGIQAVCLEARPHPEFLQQKWWDDLDIIIEEANKRDMKIWILDDSHFPTGYANGAIKEQYPQYRKRFLKLHQLDFAGPIKHAQALISYAFSDKEDKLLGVFLAKKLDYEKIDASEIIDITACVSDNQTVSFDLPQGEWKVLVLVSTWNGGEPHTENYLNPIVPEATDVLIREVYESHYEHYQEEFGKTILGFFSDEPRFGNMHGPYGSIGRCEMVLPWREDMAELLAEKCHKEAENVKGLLPLLFVDGGEAAHLIRYQYMNLVSDLYSEHFSQRIGTWCHSHGVQYIGHTIEDNNAHARLGYGAGHFFRAMKGQDMAGIDVVLHQLMPGLDHSYNKSMTGKGWDGEFFHYVLAKLGASLGHLEPEMKGRVMCEVFGAYGWAEGNRLMKWITDHMLVRGVNEFCPHAFDPKEYPDADCPPHFYAHGKNPQYPEFKRLMNYMNRMAHLLSGGVHHAPVAVLYHGEAEWSGDYMLMQKPCAQLTRHQIDFDILPIQMFMQANVEHGRLSVHKEHFQAFVIPYAEALPKVFLDRCLLAAENDLPIFFMDQLPGRCSEGGDIEPILRRLEENKKVSVVTLDELPNVLEKQRLYEIRCTDYEPYLRYYHYEQEDGHVLMLVNEAPYERIKTDVTIFFTEELDNISAGNIYKYDAYQNKLVKTDYKNKIPLELEPYESAVFCWMHEEPEEVNTQAESILISSEKICSPFNVTFACQEEYPVFSDERVLETLIPIHEIKGKESFAGVIRYETVFVAEMKVNKAEKIEVALDTVYEGARVAVNGGKEQVRICPPYCFEVTDSIKQGENRLTIEVTTTLGRAQKDWLSQFILMEPLGITEAVRIKKYRERR